MARWIAGGKGGGAGRVDMSRPGILSVKQGTARIPFPAAAQIIDVMASVGVAANLDVVVDVNKNGTSLFTNQANRPRVLAGQSVSAVATPAVTAVAAGDYLTVDVDAIGGPSGISFVGKSTLVGAFAPTSISLARPAGSQSGDVHLAVLSVGRAQNSAATTVTTPSGWTLLNKTYLTAAHSDLWVFWRRDDGTAGPWVFPTAAASLQGVNGQIITYRGCVTTGSPVDVSGFSTLAFAKDHVAPSVTTTADGDLLVFLAEHAGQTPAGWTTPSGMTARETQGNTFVADQTIATASATGTRTSSKTNDFSGSSALIALKPDPSSSLPGEDLTVVVRYQET